MCGRYQLQVSASALEGARPNTTWRNGHATLHNQRHQVRPTTTAPVLVAAEPSDSPATSAFAAELLVMKWGFTASPAQPSRPPLINARRETILELPTFRRALFRKAGSRRCAIPITGFFEWHRSPPPGKTTLTPYLVHTSPPTQSSSPSSSQQDPVTPTSIAYLAGLYDDNSTLEGAHHAFVIVTTASAPDFSWLHSRQPVFLPTEHHLRSWLSGSIPPSDAVATLTTQTGLVCTRMLKDLSLPAPKTREMRQEGITAFFSRASSTSAQPAKASPSSAKLSASLMHKKPIQNASSSKKAQSPTKPSQTRNTRHDSTTKALKVKGTISKAKTSSPSKSGRKRKDEQGGQQSIRSFFTSNSKES